MATRAQIVEYVRSKAALMSGLNRAETGIPEPFPHTDCPLAYITHTQGGAVDQSFGGASRQLEVRWIANINIVLGPAGLTEKQVEELAAPWPSRARAIFSPLYTLGGNVRDSNILEATNNFSTYRQLSLPPTITIPLEVIEDKAANGAAD